MRNRCLDILFAQRIRCVARIIDHAVVLRAVAGKDKIVCNAVIVGAMLAWESTGFSAAFAGLFAYNALTVGIGEAAVCFLLGVPLLRALEKRAIA